MSTKVIVGAACDNCGKHPAPYSRQEKWADIDPDLGHIGPRYYTAHYCGECADEILKKGEQ